MYVVELCTWIILNVSTMFKPGEIHNLVQGNDAFHLGPCHYNFQENVRL